MRRARIFIGLLAFAAWATACNQLFGIEDPNLVERAQEDAGGDGGPGTDGEASVPIDAPTDSPNGPLPTLWLFAGLDLAGGETEILVASPDGGAAGVGHLTLPSSDAVIYASGGRAFLLERKNGKVFVLDRANPTDLSKVGRIATSPSGGSTLYDSNPYAVVVADDRNAFVIRYDQNEIIVADLTNVSDGGDIPEKGRVDLSVFKSSFDPDNKVEMAAAVYEPNSKRVYVALQRIVRTFPASCTEDALIVAIDGTTGKVIDLDGSGMVTKDDAIKLIAKNPYMMTLDQKTNRLLVLGTGCQTDAGALVGRQIDAVDLGTKQVSTLIGDPGVGVTSFLYIDPNATYLQQDDGKWKRLLDGGGLGATATQIPSVPFVDRDGFIVGLVDDTPDASTRSWSVHRVDKGAELGGQVIAKPFSKINAANIYLLSSALLQ